MIWYALGFIVLFVIGICLITLSQYLRNTERSRAQQQRKINTLETQLLEISKQNEQIIQFLKDKPDAF